MNNVLPRLTMLTEEQIQDGANVDGAAFEIMLAQASDCVGKDQFFRGGSRRGSQCNGRN